MPLPEAANDLPSVTAAIEATLGVVETGLAALPATPVEADLPDIVQIVADLHAAASELRAAMATVATILSTTRVNQ
jgi:hypothetical protein